MEIPPDSLEDYLGQSIAGFEQGQTFYEKAHSYLKTKERLSAKEAFLFGFFESYKNKELVEHIKEATDVENLYARIIQGKYLSNKFEYKALMDLEERLNEAKENSEVVDITITTHTDLGNDGFGVTHKTIYSPLKVKDWYFKGVKDRGGAALHIVPEGTYCYKTENYNHGLDSVDECCGHDGISKNRGPSNYCSSRYGSSLSGGLSCHGVILLSDSACKRVEILPSRENNGGC